MTLVEWLLATAVMLVGSAVLIVFLQRQTDFLESSTIQGDLRARSQLAIGAITRDLRHGTLVAAASPPNVTIPPAPNNISLTLYLPADLDNNGYIVDAAGDVEWDALDPVQYQYDAGARRLLRTAGGVTRVVANHVTAVQFEDQTIDAALADDQVRVQLTMQETTPHGRALTATNSAVVQLRN